ncbi:MAG: PDZ domain-containing protein [Planctomycetota bacterium]
MSDRHPVEFLKHLPGVRTLREHNLLFPVLVLAGAAGILLQGALYREPAPPPQAAEEGPPAPTPPPEPRFRQDVEKTPLTYQSDYWSQLARRVAEDLVLVGPSRVPGVLIAPGLAVTSLTAADELARVEREAEAEATQQTLAAAAAAPGDDLPAPPGAERPRPPGTPSLVGVDVEQEIALFAVPGTGSGAFMATAGATLRPGAFVAAVTLASDGSPRITPGHLASPAVGGRPGNEPFDVAIPFPASTSIAAIVDLDGELLGIGVETGHGVRVLSARTVLAIVGRLGSGDPCQAIEVSDLQPDVLGMLGIPAGVLIDRVVEAAFSEGSPVQAGDVLLRWNGHDIEATEQFDALYPEADPGETVAFRVLRTRQRIDGQLRMPSADCRPPREPAVHFVELGLSVEWAEFGGDAAAQGWVVLAVREDGVAARAGLVAADLIVAVDGRSLARATARQPFDRFERRPRPILLTVRREGRIRLLPMVPSNE